MKEGGRGGREGGGGGGVPAAAAAGQKAKTATTMSPKRGVSTRIKKTPVALRGEFAMFFWESNGEK